jgi:hypothetical protein
MSDETMNEIHQLANDRGYLYRLAAKQHLTEEQMRRLQNANNRLPILWDRYRRELVAERRPMPREQRRAA